MSNAKHRFRAFGLALLATLGVVVLMATGAQAGWLYLEGGVAKELIANESVKLSKHTEDVTKLIANVNLSILCKKVEGKELKLEPGTKTTANASGKISFTECEGIEKSTGKAQANCKPAEPIEWAGKAHIFLHTNGQNYVLFEPNEGKPFTTLKFSELCALVETSNLTGTLVFECGELVENKETKKSEFAQEDCKSHQVSHLLREAPQALFPSDILKFGAHNETIDGIVSVSLNGVNAGKAWSGEV